MREIIILFEVYPQMFQALLWTAFLFDTDVTPCAYRPDTVTAEEAALMKQIVKDLVKPGMKREGGCR